MKRPAHLGVDKTSYARSLGYRGAKAVRLLDGKVISHRDVDWFQFCRALHTPKLIKRG